MNKKTVIIPNPIIENKNYTKKTVIIPDPIIQNNNTYIKEISFDKSEYDIKMPEPLPKLTNYSQQSDPLNALQKFGYSRTLTLLKDLQDKKVITKAELSGPILDFGSGVGGSALALTNYSSQVTAVDNNCDSVDILRETSWSNKLQTIVCSNGLRYMQEHPSSYEVIYAAMLGPLDYNNQQFVENFVKQTMRSIKKGGVIIVYSDPQSIQILRNTVSNFRINNLAVKTNIVFNNDITMVYRFG